MIDRLAHDARHLVYIRSPRHDMQLLEEVQKAVRRSSSPRLFFILHCYGSHFSYHERYPREFARFLPDDNVSIAAQNARELCNAYDNSVCYTDHFLAETIAYLRSLSGVSSAVLYCADHGEDLLDDERQRFLHASPTATAYQLWVASLAWFSPDYRAAFPGVAETAAANSDVPANTHALFHTMAQIAAISSPYVRDSVSLVSPAFDRRAPRYYLNDHNEAVPYLRAGLRPQDLEVFRRNGIEL